MNIDCTDSSSNMTTQFIWTSSSDEQIYIGGHTFTAPQWGTIVGAAFVKGT